MIDTTHAQTNCNRPQRPALSRGRDARSAALSRSQTQIIREVRRELSTIPYYDVFDWLQFEVRPDNCVILSWQT